MDKLGGIGGWNYRQTDLESIEGVCVGRRYFEAKFLSLGGDCTATLIIKSSIQWYNFYPQTPEISFRQKSPKLVNYVLLHKSTFNIELTVCIFLESKLNL